MTWQDWIPTGVLLPLLAWVLFALKRGIEHGFAQSLEELKAENRAKETTIAALSGSALAALSGRQVALHARRVEAVDAIWNAVTALAPAVTLSKMMTGVNFGEAIRKSKDPAVRGWAEAVLSTVGPFSVRKELEDAARSRPFVSPTAWATFSAYSAISTMAFIRWTALSRGLGSDALMNNEGVAELIVAAVPGSEDYLKKHGPESFHYFLSSLEDKLLNDLSRMLRGNEDDAEAIAQAAITLRKARAVEEQERAAKVVVAG